MDLRIDKLKKFFRLIYHTELAQNKFKENQYIRITDFKNSKTFNSIDKIDDEFKDMIDTTNLYFNLDTTDGNGGKLENLLKRTVIGLDIDKKDSENKDLDHKVIIKRFKELGIWYHAIVDSGNGYHVYIAIEPTKDIERVNKITKDIAQRVGADMKATLKTQLLRVPYTINKKNDKEEKHVRIINICELDTVKRYSLKTLEIRLRTPPKKIDELKPKETFKYRINSKCIQEIIKNGSKEGTRYSDLQKIVVVLRENNVDVMEILEIAKKWASKCTPVYDDNLEYRLNHIYTHLKYVRLECKTCKTKCFKENCIENEIEGEIITISEKEAKRLKMNNKKGANLMGGNELLVLGILKNNTDGLTVDQLVKEILYIDKTTGERIQVLSEKTLRVALNNLIEIGLITKSNHKKIIYKVKNTKTKVELTYKISYAATYEVVKGHITTDELRLYTYIRYLHHIENKSKFNLLSGNLFHINQEQLAKDFCVTQGRISQMVTNLCNEKIMGIAYNKKSLNTGFEYNVYRLIY